MNRRDFIFKMVAAGLVIPASKFIFDMGANKHRYHTILNPDYENALYEEVLIYGREPFKVVFSEDEKSLKYFNSPKIIHVPDLYPRRFNDPKSEIDIPPFIQVYI